MILKIIMITAAAIALSSCSDNAFVRTESGFTAETALCNVRAECYGNNTIRVEKYPLGNSCPEVKSFAVIKTPEKNGFSVRHYGDLIVLKTSAVSMELNVKTSVVRFLDSQGRQLISEKEESFSLTPVSGLLPERFRVSQTFLLDEDEHIYGLGQHQQGHFDMRGCHVHLENVNTEVAIPIAHSSKGYALFWDNTSVTEFDDSPEGMNFTSNAGLKSDYYLIYGGNADGVIAGIRNLTGQSPMFPLWSFGFHQSRERYVSQEQIIDVVRKYRELGVPLDGIIQDWQYWSEDHHYWNALRFGNPAFPAPKSMMDDIHSLNAHCLISVWPSFGPGTDIFRDLDAQGLLMPHSTFPQGFGVKNYDPFDKRARDIYWAYMKKYLFDAGVDGWWLDATEPEHSPVEDSDFDFITPEGTFRDLRNVFPIASVGGVYDSQRACDNSKRVFILTRSAAAGQQRYGTHVWSGDLQARWDVLAAQIPAALNFSLCGIPYWNSDIGGFFIPGELYPGGNANPDYRRLYLRWMQFGTFCGMMRSHGTHTPREIFNFGEAGSFDFDAQAKFINLRYRLLPYIYSASHEVTASATSLMRPLFAEYPEDRTAYDVKDEFFFGKSILVAPITTADDWRYIYLPEGEWVDFWGGARISGGVNFKYYSPLDSMPIFVRQGSIIPVAPTVQYAAEKVDGNMQIRIYTGADAEYELYEDAGDGYGYLDGESSVIRFRWNDKTATLFIDGREGAFPGMQEERDFNVVLVRSDSGLGLDNESSDRTVHYNGTATKVNIQ